MVVVPTVICVGPAHPAICPSLVVDGLVWLVTNRPPVLVAVLAKVRHLAALGRSLFGHSGHLCCRLCWFDIIWRRALILVPVVSLLLRLLRRLLSLFVHVFSSSSPALFCRRRSP